MTAEREGLAELKASIEAGLRKCRIDDPAPIPLIAEHDLHHVTHMVADALADLLAARDRRVRAEALREAAVDPGLRLSGHSGISITRLRDRADRIEADA